MPASREKLLTLVVPTYNLEQYLPACLQSVTASEVPDALEVIVVNDGSTDNSLGVMKDFERRRPDVVRVIDKPNGHYGSCVNAALEVARGKYFRPLDADDRMDTEALVKFLDNLAHCDSDLVVTLRTEHKSGHGPDPLVVRYPLGGVDFGREYDLTQFRIASHNPHDEFNMHSMTYRTDLLRRVRLRHLEGICYTDFQYCFLPIDRARTLTIYPLYLYQYYIGREGQSTSLAAMHRNFRHICKVIKAMTDYLESGQRNPNPVVRANQDHYVNKALDIFAVSLREQRHISRADYAPVREIMESVERLGIHNRLLHKFYFRLWRKFGGPVSLQVAMTGYRLAHLRRYLGRRKK